jgi:hypothetical protein
VWERLLYAGAAVPVVLDRDRLVVVAVHQQAVSSAVLFVQLLVCQQACVLRLLWP